MNQKVLHPDPNKKVEVLTRPKRTWGEKFRLFLRLFAFSSAGLRDAITHNCVGKYYEHKKYFNTQFKKDDQGPFKQYLSVVAIMKDEGRYIAEWIEFHKLVGVEKFYIYDNESTDITEEVLAPYIAKGEVVHIPWPGRRVQNKAYNDALAKYKMESRWIAYIDADEFIVPIAKPTIPEILKDYENEVAFSMHWMIYGDNGHKTYEPGLVIERFKAHAEKPDEYMKTIVNPRAAFAMENHHGCFIGNLAAVNENRHRVRTHSKELAAKTIRINHYWGKSWEEYNMKRVRGRAGSRSGTLPADDSWFSKRNRNEVQDSMMDQYIDIVKANIQKTKAEFKNKEGQ